MVPTITAANLAQKLSIPKLGNHNTPGGEKHLRWHSGQWFSGSVLFDIVSLRFVNLQEWKYWRYVLSPRSPTPTKAKWTGHNSSIQKEVLVEILTTRVDSSIVCYVQCLLRLLGISSVIDLPFLTEPVIQSKWDKRYLPKAGNSNR